MARKRPWTSRMDIEQYVHDLEDVYDIRVEMDFHPIPGREEQHGMYVILRAWWKDEPFETEPMAWHMQEITWRPLDRYIKTMMYALIVFTYQCVEAKIQALSRLN